MGILDEIRKPSVEAEIASIEKEIMAEQGEEVVDPTPDEGSSSPDAAFDAESEPDVEPGADIVDPEPEAKPGNAWSTMRQKLRAAEERVRQFEVEQARREGEMRAWVQQQQQQDQQPQPIDPTTNPIEALQRLTQETQQIREYVAQQNLYGQVQQAYRADAQNFIAKTPDFEAAYKHVIDARARQIQAAGATPQQAAEQLRREEMELAYSALQQGRSPSEMLYQQASIYGYKAPPKAPPKTIDMEQRKAAASTSIGRGGTANVESKIAPPEVGAKLTGAAFDKWFDAWSKTQSGGKKRILG